MKTQQTEDKTTQITVTQWAIQEFPSYVISGRLKMLCRELKLPNEVPWLKEENI